MLKKSTRENSKRIKLFLYLLTDADLFVLIVGVTGWALAIVGNLVMIIDVVVTLAGRGGCGVGAEWLAMIAAQVVDAHFHSVHASIETLGAFVHICDMIRRRTGIARDKKTLNQLTTRLDRRRNTPDR
jgi:hypothetical protein